MSTEPARGAANGWSSAPMTTPSDRVSGAMDAQGSRRFRWTRLLQLVLAWVVAAIAGVTILPGAALVTTMLLGAIGRPEDPGFSVFYLLGLVFGIAYAIGLALSFIPMAIWIVASEYLGLRAFLLHTLAGGAIGGAAWLAFVESGEDSQFDRVALDTAIAGLVAGAVYWALAGRTAGSWWAPAASPAPPPASAAPTQG